MNFVISSRHSLVSQKPREETPLLTRQRKALILKKLKKDGQIVAKDVTFTGNSAITNTCDSTVGGGHSFAGKKVRLVA